MYGQNIAYRAAALSRSRRRSDEGVRAGRAAGGVFRTCVVDLAGAAGQDAEGIRRLCEGQSRQAELRHRARHHAADHRRIFHPGRRRRHRHHSVRGRRAGARRYSRRPRPHERRPAHQPHAADPGRQAAAARLHRRERHAGTAGRADHDRKRLSAGRIPSRRLAGNLRAGGHAGRRRREAQHRDQRRPEDAGGQDRLRAARRRRHHVDDGAGIRDLRRRRRQEVAADHQGDRAEGASSAEERMRQPCAVLRRSAAIAAVLGSRARAGAAISRPRDQARGAVRAGLAGRRAGARGVAADDHAARPERGDREPARRRHLHRHQAGAVVAAPTATRC